MTMLIAPSEPRPIQALGDSSSTPETMGADILIPGSGFLVGVQRKAFPSDFLASLYDGRLATSLMKMEPLGVRILLLEGRPAWSASGALMGFDHGGGPQFSRSQLRGLLWSAYSELAVTSMWTDNVSDTVDFCRDLARWATKDQHQSLFKRPSGPSDEGRYRDLDRDKALWVLQGFPGIGSELAGRLYDYFGRLPLAWGVTADELAEVPGIGPKRVDALTKMMEPKVPDPYVTMEVSS